LIVTSEAPLGRPALIAASQRVALGQRIFGLRGAEGVLDTRFLYYAFKTDFVQRDLASRATGTTVVGIRNPELRKLRVPAPSFSEQRAIAEVLGALDDKIAANDRVAKAALELADAFYTEQANNVTERATLGAIATTVLGGTPSRNRADYWTGGTVPWIASGKANEERVLAPSEWITEEALEKSAAKLMPKRATILAITGATLGQVARLEIETSGNQSLVGVWHDDAATNDWLYFAVRHEIDELLKHATGAAQQHVNKGAVERLNVPMPAAGRLQRWGARVRPLLDQAAAVDHESLKLAATRDELLPLLMSGKLRVKDAETRASEVL